MVCPDARERAGPVGEEETQAQRARARRDNAVVQGLAVVNKEILVKLTLRPLRPIRRGARAAPGRARLLLTDSDTNPCYKLGKKYTYLCQAQCNMHV